MFFSRWWKRSQPKATPKRRFWHRWIQPLPRRLLLEHLEPRWLPSGASPQDATRRDVLCSLLGPALLHCSHRPVRTRDKHSGTM